MFIQDLTKNSILLVNEFLNNQTRNSTEKTISLLCSVFYFDIMGDTLEY